MTTSNVARRVASRHVFQVDSRLKTITVWSVGVNYLKAPGEAYGIVYGSLKSGSNLYPARIIREFVTTFGSSTRNGPPWGI